MNEINFEFLSHYIKKNQLPNFKKFIQMHGLYTTTSEEKYHEIEPWIQWPTIRTGLSYAEHRIFRLGDIESSSVRQHWEILEENGFSVAALSPINAKNNTKNSPFWVPDPWINSPVSGDSFLKRLSNALSQAVNDNAKKKLTMATLFTLIEALFLKSKFSSWPNYLNSFLGVFLKNRSSKALILDRLLADVFIRYWKKYQPSFSTIFLNAGAHLQHHYMCNSTAYMGKTKNPSWYIKPSEDPLIKIYKLYDKILGELQSINDTRLLIAVGSQQVPYEEPKFYWRLKDHKNFLQEIEINFKDVKPRMTRDFLIEYDNLNDLVKAKSILEKIVSKDGVKIFEDIDCQDNNMFITLTYNRNIDKNFKIYMDKKIIKNFGDDVVFVALKNGHHHSKGYFLDSYSKPSKSMQSLPCKNIFSIIMKHFNIDI